MVPLSFDPTEVSARQAIETQLEVSNISWIAPLVSSVLWFQRGGKFLHPGSLRVLVFTLFGFRCPDNG